MPKLVVLNYWKLPRSPMVSEIKNRLQCVYADQSSPPVWLSEPIDVPILASELGLSDCLPYQKELELELETSLEWIRVRLGESEVLYFINSPWIIHGSCIFFSEQHPDIDTVREAVVATLVRQKFVES